MRTGAPDGGRVTAAGECAAARGVPGRSVRSVGGQRGGRRRGRRRPAGNAGRRVRFAGAPRPRQQPRPGGRRRRVQNGHLPQAAGPLRPQGESIYHAPSRCSWPPSKAPPLSSAQEEALLFTAPFCRLVLQKNLWYTILLYRLLKEQGGMAPGSCNDDCTFSAVQTLAEHGT